MSSSRRRSLSGNRSRPPNHTIWSLFELGRSQSCPPVDRSVRVEPFHSNRLQAIFATNRRQFQLERFIYNLEGPCMPLHDNGPRPARGRQSRKDRRYRRMNARRSQLRNALRYEMQDETDNEEEESSSLWRNLAKRFNRPTKPKRRKSKGKNTCFPYAKKWIFWRRDKGPDGDSGSSGRALPSSGTANPQSPEATKANKKTVTFAGISICADPADPRHTRWLAVVSTAVLYNILFIVGRAVFWEMNHVAPGFWLFLDYSCDFVYLVDMFVHAHEGYLEQGIMVYEVSDRRWNYFRSHKWWYDVSSMLPTDVAYLWWDRDSCLVKMPCPVIVRINRLLRIPRMLEWFDRTETGSGYPNAIRICKVIISLSVLIHWNACLYFAISYALGFGTDNWVYNLNGARNASLSHQYIYSFYWSTLTLTTIGETPQPENDAEYVFVVADFLAGVLIFATIVGNIGSMISNMNVARVDFQTRMDGVKQYLAFRKVPGQLENRVIRWFDYIWTECGALDEEQVLSVLPDKLKAEIAISVHLETLQKVRIFQDCEPGLLEVLVLKLRLKVFSPGDFICRKGDVGKEMYIVKRGKLSVVADDGTTVFATLGAGSVFGEVSVLDIPGNRTGNRRTANVKSVGFSDLFCLAKTDLWEALADYPEARITLLERGCQLLRKDGLLDEDAFKAAQEKKATPEERLEQTGRDIETLIKNVNQNELRHRRTFIELTGRIDDLESALLADRFKRKRLVKRSRAVDRKIKIN